MKALLILVGGRPIPNILTVVHEKPQQIVAVCSHESIKDEWIQLKQAITKLSPTSHIQETPTVDAFDVEGIRDTCIEAFLTYPEADWIFNATAATSLMTLGAYMAAERCAKFDKASIRCWYLDTGHTRIINLIGEKREGNIFHLTVEEYLGAYNYSLQPAGSIKNYISRYLQDSWKSFARRLATNPSEISLLKQIVKAAKEKSFLLKKEENLYNFLKDMENIGLIRQLREEGSNLKFYASDEQIKFLDGAWLELYVFQEVFSSNFFDDIQWSKEIVDNDSDPTIKGPLVFKDLDVVATCKAHIMIIECKTGSEGLESKTLDGVVTIADLIGRAFVIKILVTSKSLSEFSTENGQENFKKKADAKKVEILTLEDLPSIGVKLKEQMENGMHSRR